MSLSTEIQDNLEDPFHWTNIHNHASNEDQLDHLGDIKWEGLNEREWANFLCEVERDDEDVILSDTDDEHMDGLGMDVEESSGSESDEEEYDVKNICLPRTRLLWNKLNSARSE
ncbi:hypothetical protein E1B28_006734 [Marasmius oreades]|uniref:Uncharacterized protein n=1 Tax=Marasmius oreades TaxID=181124 RepID=A0A9P7UWQ8_9AGAR|nr:uncharacterized protein E1B28_006734 [Marasmius oreades]KAG7096053.1 hypothetical protein E1B28_006734 [Marasmius oreades]